jgi:hypothetical protein
MLSGVTPGQQGPASGRPGCKLVPGIHVFDDDASPQDVDGRDKPGHDEHTSPGSGP